MQVGDPREQVMVAGNKKDPNDVSNVTGDSNRITALDDMNRGTIERDTRADTNMFRET